MKRTFGILFAVTLMAIMTGSLFAQEMMGMMEKTGKEAEATEAGARKMMGGKGMMSGDMMCPMCGKMMGGQGMMSGAMMQGMMGSGMPMMQGMMAGKPRIAGMAEALKLSEEQQDKLNALHIAYKKDMIRRKADKEIAEIDLQELIDQDEVDLDAVEEKLREIANLEAQTKYAWVKLLVDSKSLLSAEQKAEFKKLMKGKKGSMMMGQMMGGQGMMGAKKAEADEPAPKTESGGHEEHH